jgi:hypothetical protein
LSKHYWLNICQRRVVRQLANLADVVITNTQEHVRILERLSVHRGISCLPVSSNIENVNGESQTRMRTEFVVFGLPYGRWQTLLTFDREIRDWLQTGVLTKLHLIGATDDKFDGRSETLLKSYPDPKSIVRHGQIAAEQISKLLSNAQFALTTADELTWSKSTTLMAFFAHGCVPVTKSKRIDEPLSFSVAAEALYSIPDADLRARRVAGRQGYEANADWNILARNVSDLMSRSAANDR